VAPSGRDPAIVRIGNTFNAAVRPFQVPVQEYDSGVDEPSHAERRTRSNVRRRWVTLAMVGLTPLLVVIRALPIR